MKIEKRAHSRKRGKGNKEVAPSRTKRDPRDLGDPRGSRAPSDKIRRTDIVEKGDAKRTTRR